MGNKIKKLVCALLASAMLISSFGVVAFADDEKDVANTDSQITETASPEAAPEETQAPEVQAPAASSSAYDKDSYYQKALALCSSLGIISGYEDGSVKPDSDVTRAEMASIVLRMLALSVHSPYQNAFKDVETSHWAADQIQTAMEQSIVSGMGDGTFQPDGEVTYAQVLVMLVNALNYSYEAQHFGGWPSGYLQEAEQLGITKSVKGVSDVASKRGEVIKMVYNALLTDYRDITGYEGGSPIYKSEKTLAEAKFDVLEAKGTLWATNKTTLTDSKMQENQVQIEKDKVSDDEEKTRVYDCALTGLEDYLAQSITFYYRENKGLMPEVLAVANNASKSDSFVIDDIADIEKVTGFDTDNGSIKLYGVSKAKTCKDAKVIYNGKLLTANLYDELKDNAEEKQKPLFKDNMNDLIGKAEAGSIRLVDSDKDGNYDVVFVESYITMVVASASAERLNGEIADTSAGAEVGDTISVGFYFDDTEDRTITVTKGGSEARIRNLKKDEVASIKASLDNTVVDVVVTGESITGSATGVSTKLGESKATVNGEKYVVADVAAGDLKAGTQAVFYLDMFGRIARIEASTSGQLESGEKYGWIMTAYDSTNGEDYIIRMMTTDGKAVEYPVSDRSVDFWGPNDKASKSLSASELKTTLSAMLSSATGFLTSDGSPIRLVKYKTNSSGSITRLYCAIDETANKNVKGALKIDPTNHHNDPVKSGLVAGYKIEDGILEISVSKNASDMKNAENYKFGTVTASAYAVRESGSSRNFILGECGDSNIPTILITFVDSADALAVVTDIDTASNNPTMIITSIDATIDDDDNPVYTINGYSNHSEVSITTTKNTAVGKMTNGGRNGSIVTDGNKVYSVASGNLWDAHNSKDRLTDHLSEGDLILYDSGNRIIKVLDADEVYEQVVNGKSVSNALPLGYGVQEYIARNMMAYGTLDKCDIGSEVMLEVNAGSLGSLMFDVSKIMDTVDITATASGKTVKVDDEGSEAYDLQEFDSTTKKGDVIFARYADKGTLQEVVVYRFK